MPGRTLRPTWPFDATPTSGMTFGISAKSTTAGRPVSDVLNARKLSSESEGPDDNLYQVTISPSDT